MSDGRATTSVRQAARKAAFAAQTRRRTQQAERDKRVDAGVLALVIALKERTDAEGRAATAIRGLVANEGAKILSDDTIVELLNAKGFDIARRTVAKYREAMNIGSSVERRRQKRVG